MEVPSTAWTEEPADETVSVTGQAPLQASGWRALAGTVRHTFTHFHLELQVTAGRSAASAPPADCIWCPVDRLDSVALPTVMRKIVKHALLASA